MRLTYLLAFFVLSSLSYGQIDSLKLALAKDLDSRDSVRTILNIVNAYSAVEADSCIAYSYDGLRLSVGEDRKLKAFFLNMIGMSYGNKQDYSESIDWYKKTVDELVYSNSEPRNIAVLNNNIGWSYTELHQHDSAMVYLLKAKTISDTLEEPYVSLLVNLNFGLLYEHLNKFDLAEQHYSTALKFAEEENDLYNIALLNNNLAVIYEHSSKDKEAIIKFQKAYGIFVSNNYHYMACKTAQNIFEYYFVNQNVDSAEVWVNRAQKSVEIANSEKYQTNQFVCEARLHYLKGEWGAAIRKAKIAHERADTLAHIELIKSSAQVLAESYEKQGDFKSALAFLKIAEHYEDSIFNEENSRLLSGLISTHELNKRDLEIKNLSYQKELEEKSNKLKDKQILSAKKESRMYFFGLISLLILIGLIAYFLLQIIRTNKKVISQNLLIESQKEELTEKQTEIIDSINYAKRIQNAILPERNDLNRVLKSGFVLYLPKDIVSGDFYWMEELSESEVLIAVADCTGHGVPGAMVSVVCNNALNRSVREFGLKDPGQILDKTKEIVVEEFAKNSDNVKDGMDISMVKINLATKEGKWAGANNPLWIHRHGNNIIDQIKPDKQPIGVYHEMLKFQSHELNFNTGDRIYLFSDGFQDQFGGKHQKKYKPKMLKNFLLSLSSKQMDEIELELNKEFNNWKGDVEQLDDVCIVGFEL